MTDFETWVSLTLAERGPFTAHAVLLRDTEDGFEPVAGTWLDLGAETEWGEMILVFAGAGVAWDVAAFFGASGLLAPPTARLRMQGLEAEIDEDPRTLGAADLFDAEGARVSARRLG